MLRVLEENEWNGIKVNKIKLEGKESSSPFLLFKPSQEKENYPCILALHGLTSNKESWMELDGYTSGGNVVLELVIRS